jgi:hypothetical protein
LEKGIAEVRDDSLPQRRQVGFHTRVVIEADIFLNECIHLPAEGRILRGFLGWGPENTTAEAQQHEYDPAHAQR